MRNKMIKKFIALAMAASVACSSISVPVSASELGYTGTADESVPAAGPADEKTADEAAKMAEGHQNEQEILDDEDLVETGTDDEINVGAAEIEGGVYLVCGEDVQTGKNIAAEDISFSLDGEEVPFEYDAETGCISIPEEYDGEELLLILDRPDTGRTEELFVFSYGEVVNVRIDAESPMLRGTEEKPAPPLYEVPMIYVQYGQAFNIVKYYGMVTDDIPYSCTLTDGDEYAEVDEQGNALFKKAGTAHVSVYTEETDDYRASSIDDIEIIVRPAELSDIGIADVVLDEDSLSHVYDGGKELDVYGKVRLNDMEAFDVPVIVSLELEAADAGTQSSVVKNIRLSDDAPAENVSVSYGKTGEKGPDISVVPHRVRVALKKHSISAGDAEMMDTLNHHRIPVAWLDDLVFEDDEEKGMPAGDFSALVEQDGLARTLGINEQMIDTYREHVSGNGTYHTDYLRYSVASWAEYLSGVIEDTIIIQLMSDSAEYMPCGNYKIALSEDSAGDVEIVSPVMTDEEAWRKLQEVYDAKSSAAEGVYSVVDDNGSVQTVYAKTGDKLVFYYWSDGYGFFDRVVFPGNDGSVQRNEYVVPAAPDGPFSMDYYFDSSSDPSGATRSYSPDNGDHKFPPGVLIVDNTVPHVEIHNPDLSAYKENDSVKHNWFIELFTKEKQDFQVSVQESGSGLKEKRYKVVQVSKDSDVDAAIQNAVGSEEYRKWKVLPASGTVSVDTAGNTFQLIMVWAEDRVGNSALVTSNGLVVDTTEPVISIDGFDTDKVYDGDVEYSLVLNDFITNAHSGLASLDVCVLADGEPLAAKEARSQVDLSGSFHASLTDGFLADPQYQQDIASVDRASGNRTITCRIPAADAESNNVQIRVTVQDMAGNTAVKTFGPYMIDNTPAEITQALSGEANLQRYFRDTCELEITFKERNFDPARTRINMNISERGKAEYSRSLPVNELQDIDSVSLVSVEDSQAGMGRNEYTDSRTVTYRFKLGDKPNIETRYKWDVEYLSADGTAAVSTQALKGSGLKTKSAGIWVDKTAPRLGWTVSRDDNGEKVSVCDAAQNAAYYNSALSGKLTVSDRTFHAGSAPEGYAQIETTAKDGDCAWDEDGKVYTCAYQEDGTHSFQAVVKDFAGNTSEIAVNYFGIDRKVPTAVVRQNTKSGNGIQTVFDRFVENIRELLFHNEPVDFTIENAADDRSGVASVEYYADMAAGNADRVLSVLELTQMPWTVYEDGITVGNDCTATVYARVTDRAGNVSYINTNGVIVDSKSAGSPVVSVELKGGRSGGFFTDDVPFEISVSDPDVGGTYSGLRKIEWYVMADGNTVLTQQRTETAYGTARAIKTAKVEGVISKTANEQYEDVALFVKAYDYAGNETTYVLTDVLKIDTTAPQVTASYLNNDVRNGKYFKDTRSLLLTIKEPHLNLEKTGFDIVCNGKSEFYTISDLTAGRAGTVRTDGLKNGPDGSGTYELRLDIGQEGDTVSYSIRPHIEDEPGFVADVEYAEGTKAPEEFVVDMVAPVIETKYILSSKAVVNGSKDQDAPLYDTVSVTPSFTVTEEYLADGEHEAAIRIDVSGTDYEGNSVNIPADPAERASRLSNWDISGAKASCVMTPYADPDANYSIGVTVTDLAGNRASAGPEYFTIDRTPATGQLVNKNADKDNVFDSLVDTFTGFFFSREDVAFEIRNVKDATSGIGHVMYYVTDKEDALTVQELNARVFTEYEGPFMVPKESQGAVYVKLTDKAGNVSYVNSSNLVVVDTTKPGDPAITIKTKRSGRGGIYTSDVKFEAKVQDPLSGGTYSGLHDIKWYVLKGNEKTQEVSVSDSDQVFRDAGKRIMEYTFEGTVLAEPNNLSDVRLFVTAVDNAGNRVTKELGTIIRIDTTKPYITASYENNDFRNGKYFRSGRTMTCEITEKNFSEAGLMFLIGVDGNAGEYSVSDLRNGRAAGVRFVGSEQDTENGKYIYRLEFGYEEDADHDFEVSVHVTDEAGNESDGVVFADKNGCNEAFTVDKVAPVVTVSYRGASGDITPGTEPASPAYDRENVTLTLSARERNLAKGGSYGIAEISLDAKDIAGALLPNTYSESDILSAETLSNWTHDKDSHSYVMPAFTQDANYAFSMRIEDLAGNETVYGKDYFTVDGTAPSGTLYCFNESDNLFIKLAEAIHGFVFSKEDIEYGLKDVSDRTSGISGTYYYIDQEGRALGAGELSKMDFVPCGDSFRVPLEGQGVAYVKLTDKAGNVTYIGSSKLAIADKTKPNLKDDAITIDTEPGKNGFYTSDVVFKIKTEDPKSGETYSGLSEVIWKIKKVISENPVKYAESNPELITKPFEDKTRRVQELPAEDSEGIIPSKEYDSNQVYLDVSVKDNAGNEVTKTYGPYKIDVTKPEITMSFVDNNSPENGRYYNKARIMEVGIIEKNFDESGLTFDITVDGVKNTYSVNDIRSGKVKGVSFVSRSETFEKNKDDTKRKNTYKIKFGDGKTDHDYVVEPHVEDLAGNRNDAVQESSFTIDEIAPVLTVVYTGGTSGKIECSTDPNNPSYDRNSMAVELNVTERNFITSESKSGIDITVGAVDASGRTVSAYSESDIRSAEDAATWSHNGSMHTKRMALFTNDANYSFTVSLHDLAGNTAVGYNPRYFTVDKTPPTGSVSTGAQGLSGLYKTLYERVRFWFFDNKSISVERTAEDATSGVSSVKYYVWEPGPESRGTFSGLSASALSGVSWTDWSSTLRVNPDKGAIVYERIQDRAGNVTYINTEGGIISEGSAPAKPVIQITASAPANGIYNTNVPFSITVTEQESGGTYSGLKSVSYRILNNGSVTQSGNYDNELSDRTARVREIRKTETIDAQRNNSNHVKIEVTASDYAGNTVTESKDIMIDVTAPVIEITYDNNSPRNGKYYNTVRTATVRVIERNFNPSDFKLTTTEVRGANPVVSGWSLASNMGESDQAVSTCTVAFQADGDYTLTAACQDKAGNKASYSRVDSFIVDRTAPVIDVSFDRNDGKYEKYYNETRNASIKVTDRFMAVADGCRVNVTARLDGKAIDAPSLGAWQNGQDSASNSISFVKDGDYVLELTCTDLAGNEAKVYRSAGFTIDKTAPEIQFFNIADKSANKGNVQPGIRFADRNFVAEGITIELTGTRHKSKSAEGVREYHDQGGTFVFKDIEHTPGADDIYTVLAVITDKAGNKTEQVIRFSVNRFGSVYTFDERLKGYLKQYYLKDVEGFTVTETNADFLKGQTVIVSRDGEIIPTKKGRDYTIDEENDEGSWKIYNYNFRKELFAKEGLYEIRINSKDAAGNDQDNQIKNEPIRFIVDHTAPSVSLAGISDKGRYKETKHVFEIVVTDNFTFGQVELFINGKLTETFSAKDIEKAKGRLEYTLKNADDWQEVKVVATDAAGNQAKDKSIRVLVTTNAFLQYRENKPLFYGTTLGPLAFIIFLFFLLRRKKKKEEQGSTDELKHTDELEKATDDIAES